MLLHLHPSSSVQHVIASERKEVPHSASAATAATLATQAGGGVGNADRQQSGSKARAEGKGMMCIRTGGNSKSDGEGKKNKRERGQSEKWANRKPSLQRLLEFGQQPIPPSVALREMEREERRGWVGGLTEIAR